MASLLVGLSACRDAPQPEEPGPGADAVAANLMPAVQIEGQPEVLWDLEERMDHHRVPAVSVAVLQGGEVLWSRAWGLADVEARTPATPETLFQAASMSKPVAALVALTLVEEGRVELDAPANRFLTRWRLPDNEFTADSAVTLRGLMTHSAGTTVWGFPGYRKDRAFGPDQPLPSNAQVLDGLGNTEEVRVFKVPGTSMRYSGGGYTIMEQVVEDATGMPFEEAARERVLGPAGMERSTYAQPLPEDRWPEAARGYRGNGDEVPGEWHSYPEQAAAGLWTTPTELAELSVRLLDILEGDSTGFVSPATLEAAMTPNHPGDPAFQNWGLGFGLNGAGDSIRFGHGGANEGFRSQWVVYRDTGDGAVIMTNGDRGSALIGEILRSLAHVYGWRDFAPVARATRPLVPEEAAAYAGEYVAESDSNLVVTIRAEDGGLRVVLDGQEPVTLRPAADTVDAFFDPGDGTVIRFERDAAGAVVAASQGNGSRIVRREGGAGGD
ncbi:MAG TPA: serine hydrolase domain-containing protein [Longimicrobiales bacterium]|nr:serine hydrolase domain-containing protein [Longimicrobiales bacterium]